MATRRKSTRRKTSTTRRRRAPARRRTTTTTRRRRRRRNPKFDVKGTLIGAAGGAILGVGAYALSQQNLTPTTTMAAIGAIGLLAGAAASGWRKDVGAGIAGGTGAILAGYGAQMLYDKSQQQTSGMGAVRRMPMSGGGGHAQFGAVQTRVGPRRKLVMSGMGAVQAPVSDALSVRLSGMS